MLEGALILLAGILVGRLLPSRRRHPKLPEQPKPVCGCTHHYATHDPKTSKCKAGVGKELLPCACQRYSGPEPMPTYYAPEIATEESGHGH